MACCARSTAAAGSACAVRRSGRSREGGLGESADEWTGDRGRWRGRSRLGGGEGTPGIAIVHLTSGWPDRARSVPTQGRPQGVVGFEPDQSAGRGCTFLERHLGGFEVVGQQTGQAQKQPTAEFEQRAIVGAMIAEPCSLAAMPARRKSRACSRSLKLVIGGGQRRHRQRPGRRARRPGRGRRRPVRGTAARALPTTPARSRRADA